MRNIKIIGMAMGLFVLAAAGIAAGTSCADAAGEVAKEGTRVEGQGSRVEGQGSRVAVQDDLVSEVRNVSGFTGVDIGGAMTAKITAGRDYEVIIEAKADVLPKIITEVKNGVLVVKYEKNWWKSMRGKDKNSKVRVTVSLPELDDLDISGASKATVAGVNTDKFKIDISGASNVSIEGTARAINVDLSGASNMKAANLYSDIARMDLSGASSAKVSVTSELDVEASGASSVCYTGSPRVKKETSGASSVSGGCGTP